MGFTLLERSEFPEGDLVLPDFVLETMTDLESQVADGRVTTCPTACWARNVQLAAFQMRSFMQYRETKKRMVSPEGRPRSSLTVLASYGDKT